MAITETFEDVAREYTTNSLPTRIPNRDGLAMERMWTLADNMSHTKHLPYARGSWGYTIFRTVYTEESNQLFSIAVEKLQKYVSWWAHYNCFAGYGEMGLERERKRQNRSINDEVVRRFRIEVIEDPDKLDIPILKDATSGDIKTLCSYFSNWVRSVGADPDDRDYSVSPRFLDFLVIDADALRSLTLLSDETPPQRVARDIEELRHKRAQADAWLWFLDYQTILDYEQGITDPGDRGWMKIRIAQIAEAWFYKAGNLESESRGIHCREDLGGSGGFWYVSAVLV